MSQLGMSYDEVYHKQPFVRLLCLTASGPKYRPKVKKKKHLFDVLAGMSGPKTES